MRRFGQVSTDLTERMPFPIAEESHRANVTLGTEVWCPKDNEIPPATSEQDENLDAVRVLFVMRKAATPHSEIGTPKKAPTDGSCGNLPVYLNWSEESDLTVVLCKGRKFNRPGRKISRFSAPNVNIVKMLFTIRDR